MRTLIDTFRNGLTVALLSSILWPAVAEADKVAEAYIKRFGDAPVEANGIKEAQNRPVQLLEVDGEQLKIRGEFGAIEIEVTPELAGQMRVAPKDAIKIDRMLRLGQAEEALPLLREAIYPFLRFASLPDDFGQIHQPIETLLAELMKAGKYQEVAYLVKTYPDLAGQDTTLALALAALDLMRADGDFESLIPIYGSVAEAAEAHKAESLSMKAYCEAQSGKLDAAKATLAQVGELSEKDDAFSVNRFAAGYTRYKEGDIAGALDLMARGIVYAKPTEGWIPEATFFIADCYRQGENYDAALGAYQEVFKLDQNPLWAEKAKKAHEEVTKVVREINEKKAAEAKRIAEEKAAAEKP